MLTAATLLVIAMLFGGGFDSFTLNPDMKKNVHKYVQDKDRVHEIDNILKQCKKDQKQFYKKTKKGVKQFEELTLNWNADREDFTQISEEYFADLESLQKKYIDSELKILSLIEENEWNQIMDKVISEPDREKDKKHYQKVSTNLNHDLLGDCEKVILDEESLLEAKKVIESYKNKTDTVAKELSTLGYKHQESIRKYGAQRADFEVISDNKLAIRKQYLNQIIDMRFQLKELTDEEGWKSLAKEINKVFKKYNSSKY